eukprot:TRINITY_DN5196_c0_g1_i4.p1 TRINITY_DN5196_c0_g1~~TRINITY_DN5196_c0_g1_i4.p1  ORF type:complete len:361 (-),score=61.40 TRINITY_DN5196_c0_g1_i4:193-1275(-)
MARTCYTVHSEFNETDWSEAARRYDDGEVPESAQGQRALCDCGLPLHRYARVPAMAALLMCTRTKDCDRCEDTIESGEMHFICAECRDVSICKECGPGVYVEREFDFFDPATNTTQIKILPSRVIHERKTRSLNFVDAGAKRIATTVLENIKKLIAELAEETEDEHDFEWHRDGLVWRLLGVDSEAQAAASIMELCEAAKAIFEASPSLSEAKLPCKIFGDIHGQLRDVLMLVHSFGMPGTPDAPNAVFNGDFVDRGRHQLECILLLFSLKVLHPTNIFLNRGNHEDDVMNKKYGFSKACNAACGDTQGPTVFKAVSECFTYLPLGFTPVLVNIRMVGDAAKVDFISTTTTCWDNFPAVG